MPDDPLNAIEHLPVETQVAVVISVLRSTRNQLGRIEKKLDWVSRSIWALIGTIVAGVAVYYFTVGTHPGKTTYLPPRTTTTQPQAQRQLAPVGAALRDVSP